MKNILFFILLFNTAKAQNYTTKVLSKMIRDVNANISVINVNVKKVSQKLDSSIGYLSLNDFDYDSVKKLFSIKRDRLSMPSVDDLKFQIIQLEKSADVRDKIIDKLQLTLKKERAKNKLKK